jgi:hypothetical protein
MFDPALLTIRVRCTGHRDANKAKTEVWRSCQRSSTVKGREATMLVGRMLNRAKAVLVVDRLRLLTFQEGQPFRRHICVRSTCRARSRSCLPSRIVSDSTVTSTILDRFPHGPFRNFPHRCINIRRSVWCGRVQTLKTRTSAAPISLPPALADVLREYRNIWKANPQGFLLVMRNLRPPSSNKVVEYRLWPLLVTTSRFRCVICVTLPSFPFSAY